MLAAEPHTEDGQAAPLPSGDTREGSRAPGTGRPECAGHPSAKRACDACVGGRAGVCGVCGIWCVQVCAYVCMCVVCGVVCAGVYACVCVW